jgi:hypothetical protein
VASGGYTAHLSLYARMLLVPPPLPTITIASYHHTPFTLLFRQVRKNCEKRLLRFVMPVRPSAWDISGSTDRIFMKFGIRVFFSKIYGGSSSLIKIGQK